MLGGAVEAGEAQRIGLVTKVVPDEALVLLYVFGRTAGASVPRFSTWVESLGAWGPIVFVAGYAVATVAFVPGSLLTLAAGAVFGWW